ncbi:disulfide bond formation protein B [Pelagibacteraceae bacterium]|nr:disulfide bond formation protein B [Pelagibacteraceae bacterium]
MQASKTQIIFALLFVHISILLSAYYIQYVLEVPPCPMCQYQRIPYYLAVVTLGIFFLNIVNFKKLILVLIFLSILNIVISFYHVGIEQGFFNELTSCKDDLSANNTQELLKELSNTGIVSCKEVTFRIFGFSLATLNFLVNIAIVLFYSLILKYEK